MTISYEMLASAVRQEFQSIRFQIRSELRRARTRQQQLYKRGIERRQTGIRTNALRQRTRSARFRIS